MSMNTTVTTTAITGMTARRRRIRYANMRDGQTAWRTGGRLLGRIRSARLRLRLAKRRLFLEPHVVEADALGGLVEALHGVARRPQPEEIAVADDRDLLVEL